MFLWGRHGQVIFGRLGALDRSLFLLRLVKEVEMVSTKKRSIFFGWKITSMGPKFVENSGWLEINRQTAF
jgi:hypothetical protein